MAKEPIFVTGCAGFIGSHLVDRLLERGDRVVGVDNLSLDSKDNLRDALANPDFTFIEADLADPKSIETLRPHFAGVHVVWHMAANSDIQKGVADPGVDLRDTFMTTFNTLQLMRATAATELIFSSSSAIYGEKDEALTEDVGPLLPISNYGAMKLASEALISAAAEQFLKKAWIFRFPNVVGSRSTHGAIHDFVKRLKEDATRLRVLGDGSQTKPYVHVGELLDAMFLCVERASERRNYFNIGQGDGASSVKFIAESVVKRLAPNAVIEYTGGDRGWVGDVPRVRLSIEKIERLGWKPQMTSDDAVVKAIEECV